MAVIDISADNLWSASGATLRRVLYRVMDVSDDQTLKEDVQFVIDGNYGHFSLGKRSDANVSDFVTAVTLLIRENKEENRTDVASASARELFIELKKRLEQRLLGRT